MHSSVCGDPLVLALFVGKAFLSPLNCLGTFVENQMTINVRVHLWTFNSFH